MWEITEHDVDQVIAALVKRGVAQTTRRGYVQAFRGFFGFLVARKAVEIEALFGCRLRDPLDRFNSARHVSSETPGLVPPPTVERVDAFFEFLRGRLETARTWAPAARDYALFRTLYHAGLRAQEAAALELRDVHFNRGPFGKLHVRLGKGARGSGPRPRWVPMLDQLDELLRWYLAEARPLCTCAAWPDQELDVVIRVDLTDCVADRVLDVLVADLVPSGTVRDPHSDKIPCHAAAVKEPCHGGGSSLSRMPPAS